MLLKNNLCDQDTIILYYDLENDREAVDKRSQISIDNFNRLFEIPTEFKIRTIKSITIDIAEIYLKNPETELELLEKKYDKKKNKEGKIVKQDRTRKYINIMVDILKLKSGEFPKKKLEFRDTFLKNKCEELNIDFYEFPEHNYYVKTPFSGSSNCSSAIQLPYTIKIEELYPYILENVEAGFYQGCLGKYFGVILQPENKNFFEKGKLGEIRCFCKEGKVKIMLMTDKSKQVNQTEFMIVGVHKSVYLNLISSGKLGEYGNNFDDFFKGYENEFVYGNRDYIEHEINNYNSEEIYNLHNTDIIQKCQIAYDLIKSELNLEGIHHRIDFIKSKDGSRFDINEIENINYGNMTDKSINFFPDYEDENLDENYDYFYQIQEHYSSIREILLNLKD